MLSPVVYGWLEETHTCKLHILQIESLHLKASYCLLADPAKLQPASLDKHTLLGCCSLGTDGPMGNRWPQSWELPGAFVGDGIPSFTSKAHPKGSVRAFSSSLFLIP